jgi:shikimate dehydrogenase
MSQTINAGHSNAPLLSGRTQIVGVIGWPIEHSVSPPMHNAAFRALGLDWCYVPFPVPPERVPEALAGVRALGLRGINATVPHKQALLSLVDELTPEAQAIGAANTVIVRGERLIGHNTDARGFLRALGEAGFRPEGCAALVLGAGGAARAVVYGLATVGARVTILNRTEDRALALAAAFAGVHPQASITGGPLEPTTLARMAEGAQLIVNTTPLGMWPRVECSPWPEGVEFPSGAMLYDLIYNPRETLLMRRARAAGAPAVDGLGMLVHQGAEAFELWTGVDAPVDVMRAACVAALGGE